MFKFGDVSKMAKTESLYHELYGEMDFLNGLYLIWTMRECYYLNDMDPLAWWKENDSIFLT